MHNEMSDDLLFVAENEPVRLSELNDRGAAMTAAGLLDAGDTFGVLTLDGCDAVDAIRRARAA